MLELTEMKSLGDWPKVRRKIEASVEGVLGKIAKESIELQVKTTEDLEFPGYLRSRINYFVDDWARVSAWLFVPTDSGPKPALLCLHDQTRLAKDEAAGIEGDPSLAFARRYAEQGYVTLAPDCITTGGRVSDGLPPFDTAMYDKDNPDLSVLGKMLVDHMRAVDVLIEDEAVDEERIGVIGHGLGGVNALMLPAFDERVRCSVASCAFTRMSEDKDAARWARETGFTMLPKLRKAIEKKDLPFDWEHVLALCAPNPILLLTALNDEVLPNTKSCDKAISKAKTVYKLLGEPQALENFTHKEGRIMCIDALQKADEWLQRWI